MQSSADLFSLTGRTALVTGATGHLGTVMGWALARAGAHVLVNSRCSRRAGALVEAMRAEGLAASPAVFDLTDSTRRGAASVLFADQPLHILVNNAYAGGAGTIGASSADAYRESYDIAVVAAHDLLIGALPALRLAVRRDGDASVINIASMYGSVSPDPRVYAAPEAVNPPFYGAAKAALIQWSRYAACEFGREGIRVNSLSPGPFPAPAVQAGSPEFVAALAAKVPMGRVGSAEEIGGPLLFLASPAASFVNGTNLVVDGGWTAW